jgi:glycosyltransferase involved in cell wall biosynthesis
MNEMQTALNERFLLQEEYLGNDKIVNKIFPVVSVTVATYQHANFIKECLEGILMQKTDFPFEVILGEDGSIDGTQEICKEYAEKYPDKIRLFIRDRKLSQYHNSKGEFVRRFNGMWNRMSARGKYIAPCEGDDYWTDPLKLQKQVDFLEANPEYNLCCHRYKIYDEITKKWDTDPSSSVFKDNNIEGITFDNDSNFSTTWFTQTMTIVFRKNAIDFSTLNKYKYVRDVHLYYHLLKAGKGYCMNFEGAVYRLHAGGIYSKTTTLSKNIINYKVFSELYRFNPEDLTLKNNCLYLRDLIFNSIQERFNRKEPVEEISHFIKNEYKINGLKGALYCISKVIFYAIQSFFRK